MKLSNGFDMFTLMILFFHITFICWVMSSFFVTSLAKLLVCLLLQVERWMEKLEEAETRTRISIKTCAVTVSLAVAVINYYAFVWLMR